MTSDQKDWFWLLRTLKFTQRFLNLFLKFKIAIGMTPSFAQSSSFNFHKLASEFKHAGHICCGYIVYIVCSSLLVPTEVLPL